MLDACREPQGVSCSGWRGASDLHDSTSSAVCKLVKKERKELEADEDGDEILCKLQRDDVSICCLLSNPEG